MDSALFHPAIERALRVAFEAHEGQTRKGDPIPYVSHPVHVALLLARAGADDVTLQAAILHDVVEDCDGWDEERIGALFGEEVRATVAHVTEVQGLPWEERKESGVEHVSRMDLRAVMVKAADKTHNMRSMAEKLDVVSSAEDAWRPFSRGPAATIDMAERLVNALVARLEELDGPAVLAEDLRAAFAALVIHHPSRA